ncbi:S41 family peptidase [Streptomyces sp. NPDC002181]|uniref:S41 family peptidase n=1 Tax=Streptomyces sp. NPDC002181 TaxID=3364635 RepID=UPI0036AC629F
MWAALRRRAAPAFLTLLLLVAAGDAWVAADGSGRDAPEGAREYLSRALDLMEAHSVRRDQVDWPRLRRDAYARTESARTPSDTYAAIMDALTELGDHHSSFLTPVERAITRQASEDTFTGLTGRQLPGPVGYLSLPGVGVAPAGMDTYVRQGRAAVKEAERDGIDCGWIVDLRQNTGGSVWPMFAVAAPLLGEGKVGSFVFPDGSSTPWYVKNRRPGLNGKESRWGPADPVGRPDAPVAVLTDGRTASAGEALLIAFEGRPDTRTFGTASSGLPTANSGFTLSDGAAVNLTTSLDADRTGRTYDGPIPPDEEVPTARADIRTDRDETLKAATRWLLGQDACRGLRTGS